MNAPRSVTPRDLQSLIHDGRELALIDVREAGQFGESHLLFAVPVPYSRLEPAIGALVPRKSVRVVLCDDGESGTTTLAAERLRALGYSDVSVLAGGTRAWKEAGYPLFAGVNVPSKLFGELIEHEYHTPRVTVQALTRMQAAGENFVIVDGRPFAEYQKMNIPGGICCPNAELPYRIREIVRDPTTRIVVNCAGRTRSILGAQTLINFGVPNPVCALENGTQGWVLADLELERGASRRYPDRIPESSLPPLRQQADALMKRFGVERVAAAQVERWFDDPQRTTYLLDVRTPEEFEAGSVPGAVHAPGGQLVQATDQWAGVRNATLVLLDNEGVRAAVVASWLKQLGFAAYVLEEGTSAKLRVREHQAPALPELTSISTAALKAALASGQCTALDLRASMSFRRAHIPGSRWTIRPRIASDVRGATGTVVLIADERDLARVAAIDLTDAGWSDVRYLEGGFDAWTAAGYDTESSPDSPPDEACIDYLFFVHDRHAGNRAAMRQYLAWETGLIAQLRDDDRKLFRVGATSS